MSHFTTIKTQITDKNVLLKALSELGFSDVECHETAQHLYGFQGDARAQTAEIIIRRKYVGSASNDIGFKRHGDGTFEAIISEYDRRTYSQQWVGRLQQRYAYHTVREQLDQNRFTLVEEKVEADQTIRLVVRRVA